MSDQERTPKKTQAPGYRIWKIQRMVAVSAAMTFLGNDTATSSVLASRVSVITTLSLERVRVCMSSKVVLLI